MPAEPRVTCAQVATSHSWGSWGSCSSMVLEPLKGAQAATQELRFLLQLPPSKVSRPLVKTLMLKFYRNSTLG